jgi:pimeloyl-ACP methyl ester carboxylesterase
VPLDAGISGHAVVILHSMGGFVAITTAARHPDSLGVVVICEFPVTA